MKREKNVTPQLAYNNDHLSVCRRKEIGRYFGVLMLSFYQAHMIVYIAQRAKECIYTLSNARYVLNICGIYFNNKNDVLPPIVSTMIISFMLRKTT